MRLVHEDLGEVLLPLAAAAVLLRAQHAAKLHLMDLHVEGVGGRQHRRGLAAFAALRNKRRRLFPSGGGAVEGRRR